MTTTRIQKWREHAARAAGWQSGDDPEPVLEALAWTVALELIGDLARLPSADRDALRKVGQRAMLHLAAHTSDDEDELEAMRMCAAIARDGLRALAGRPPASEEPPGADVRTVIPPGDLIRLLEARLDGFAAGALALRVRRSAAASSELRMMLRLAEPEERSLSIAAAEAVPVLDPASGRAIAVCEALAAEAVLFDGAPRRLAVYAEDPEPLRLIAPELTTEDVREGYWVGRIADGARTIDAVLHAGDRSVRWTIALPEVAVRSDPDRPS